MALKSRKLKCDNPSCEWEGYMRTKCKNKESEYYRKYLCRKHSKEESGFKEVSKKIKRTLESNKTKKKERDDYFEYHLDRCFKSEESGARIFNASRLNICHILPKYAFNSVQGDYNNYIYLTGDEHTEFDNLFFKLKWEELELKFPNSWSKVKSRLNLLLPKVTENNKMIRSIKEYLEWED